MGGLSYWSLRRASGLGLAHYTFVDGYLILAPGRALLDRAIRYRDGRINLAHSPDFQALFPEDGHANFSALVYQDLVSGLARVADKFAGAQGSLTSEQQATIQQLASEASPTLFCGYAEADRIRFAGLGPGGLFGGELGTLLTMGGLAGLEHLADHAQAHRGAGAAGSPEAPSE